MKNNIKIITIIVVALVLTIGIKVNALGIPSTSNNGNTVINVPIHKTDEDGKALEGVEFTLTGLNSEAVSYTSTYQKDGDYLFKEATDVHYYNPTDFWWYNDESDTVNNNIDFLPKKYQDMIKNIKSWEDVEELKETSDFYVYQNTYDSEASFQIIFPVIIDETKVPNGYEKQKIVVPAGFSASLYDNSHEGSIKREDYEGNLNDINIDIETYITILTDDLYLPAGYFTYEDGVDYVEIFDKVNKEAAKTFEDEVWGFAKYKDILVKEGFNTKKVDCSLKGKSTPINDDTPRRVEFKFDEDITNTLCIIQLENKRVIVNPETYGTVVVVLILAIASMTLPFVRKAIKTN